MSKVESSESGQMCVRPCCLSVSVAVMLCDCAPLPASYAEGIIFLGLLVMMFHWSPSGSAPIVSSHFALT